MLFPSIFFRHPVTPDISTLSLHDALPISTSARNSRWVCIDLAITSPWPGRIAASFPVSFAAWECLFTPRRLKDRKSTRLNSSHRRISYTDVYLKETWLEKTLQSTE